MDDSTWKQRAFDTIKATLELKENELAVLVGKVRQLRSDLQDVCSHIHIEEIELKDYHDNGYGKFWSEFDYKCADCGKKERGQYNPLGRIYNSRQKEH